MRPPLGSPVVRGHLTLLQAPLALRVSQPLQLSEKLYLHARFGMEVRRLCGQIQNVRWCVWNFRGGVKLFLQQETFFFFSKGKSLVAFELITDCAQNCMRVQSENLDEFN